MIQIENLYFKYKNNKNYALKNINLNIDNYFKGKFISVVGPNGCGKSTLLKLINKSLSSDKGNIHLDGKHINGIDYLTLSKLLSTISQEYKIAFPFKVIDYITMGSANKVNNFNYTSNLKLKDSLYALKLTHTEDFYNKAIDELSGGELQRVRLARSICQKPKILILDEAFSMMDISYKIKMINTIKNFIIENNILVISVMHDLNLVYNYSDFAIILKDGELKKFGETKKVLNVNLLEDVFDIKTTLVENQGFLITP